LVLVDPVGVAHPSVVEEVALDLPRDFDQLQLLEFLECLGPCVRGQAIAASGLSWGDPLRLESAALEIKQDDQERKAGARQADDPAVVPQAEAKSDVPAAGRRPDVRTAEAILAEQAYRAGRALVPFGCQELALG